MNGKLTKLFENNRFLTIFALVVALLLYIIVAMTDKETIDYTIQNVPVNLDTQSSNLANLRLQVVEGTDSVVDIKVNGPRTVVPQLRADSPELATTARLNDITGPGEWSVQVVSAVTGSTNSDIKIVSYSPRTIKVKVDRYRTASFDIEPLVKGLSYQAGYIFDKQYTVPAKVQVTGPEAEVAKIAGAQVHLELTESLSQTYAPTLPIQLVDAQGEIIDTEKSHLTLDVTEAQLVLSILKETGLPLEVGFLNPPRNFPLEELREFMRMSVDYVRIAGPEDVVDRLTEIRLGYIDIKELHPGESTYTFPLGLEEYSDQIQSLDNVNSVTVYFDGDWDAAYFSIENIELINVPAGYEVTLADSTISSVQFVGTPAVLAAMTADDIVAEIDLSDRDLTTGQQNVQVKISAPSKGLVWALGDYVKTIQVAEKTE